MNVDQLDAVLRNANPVPDAARLNDDLAQTDSLLLRIKSRSGVVHRTDRRDQQGTRHDAPGTIDPSESRAATPTAPMRYRRGLIVAGVGFLGVLIVGAGLLLTNVFGSGAEVAAPPTEPVVTLRDGECGYRGPTTFELGTLVSFRFVNEASEAGSSAIYRLMGDPTFDEFAKVISDYPLSAGPPPSEFATLHGSRNGVAPGTEAEYGVGFTDTHKYGLVCETDFIEGGTDRVYPGALLEVK